LNDQKQKNNRKQKSRKKLGYRNDLRELVENGVKVELVQGVEQETNLIGS
jgi:hypothetical protein